MQCTRYLYSSFTDPTFHNSFLFCNQTGYISKKKIAITTVGAVLEQVPCITAIFGVASHTSSNVHKPPAWTWVASVGAFIGSLMIFNCLNKTLCNKELCKAEERHSGTPLSQEKYSPLLQADCCLILASEDMEKAKTENKLLFNILKIKGIVTIIQEYSDSALLSTAYDQIRKLDYLKITDKSIIKIKDALLTSGLKHLNDNPDKLPMVRWTLQLSKEHQKIHFNALYAFHAQGRNTYITLLLIEKAISNEQLIEEYLEKFVDLLINYPHQINWMTLGLTENIIGDFFNLILLQPISTPTGKIPSLLALELDNAGYEVFDNLFDVHVGRDKAQLLMKSFITYAQAEGIISLQRNSQKLLSALRNTASRKEFVNELLKNNFHK